MMEKKEKPEKLIIVLHRCKTKCWSNQICFQFTDTYN